MSYKVIHYFTDLQDFNHPYHVGDTFPREGMKVSEKRLEELSTSKNKQKKPLIKLVEPVEVKEIKEEINVTELVENNEYTKTEINRMSTADLKELAKKENIDNAEDMTGAELKKVLIKHFNL